MNFIAHSSWISPHWAVLGVPKTQVDNNIDRGFFSAKWLVVEGETGPKNSLSWDDNAVMNSSQCLDS